MRSPERITETLGQWAAVDWPGAWFVRLADPSGRLALLYAAALGARSGHDYVGCEHLVAGSLRAGAMERAEATAEGPVRAVAAASVAASRRLAEVRPADVEAWFADESAADPSVALASLELLPTLTRRAGAALHRARAAASGHGGPGAVHVLSGVLGGPGIVVPAAEAAGVDLGPVRQWAEVRSSWGPLLDLVEELS